MPGQPTFYQDIQPLFTQYDRVMMMFYCDFWNYEQVKARAKSIHLCLQPAQPPPNPGGWSKLPEVHVMPVGTGPWPQQNIDLFGEWITADCPEGVAPPAPPQPGPLVPVFIGLSQVLTGFDNLDILGDVNVLAQIYIDRLSANASDSGKLKALLDKVDAGDATDVLDGDGKVSDAFAEYGDLLKAVTLAWYTATVDGAYGTPGNTQYVQGLEWRAIAAHPMGFANENVPFYWQFEPEADMYSGLISWKPPS